MHDYFDILGVPCDAPLHEIRRAGARRAHKVPPDFDAAGASVAAGRVRHGGSPTGLHDVAIDFVDMAEIADRMQAAFFVTRPGLSSVAHEA